MEKQENKQQINNLIKKVLDNSYVDLRNYSVDEIVEMDFLDKFKKIGVDVSVFDDSIISQGKERLHSYQGRKYDCYCVFNNILYYVIIGKEYVHNDIKSVSNDYRKINIDLINELLEYKEEKISIKELAEFLRDNKTN